MRVVITRRAREEILSIGRFVAVDNPAAGLRLVDELFARCEGLAEAPERGARIAQARRSTIRRLVHGSYLIVYGVGADAVRIHRVVHGARSPALLLKDVDLS